LPLAGACRECAHWRWQTREVNRWTSAKLALRALPRSALRALAAAAGARAPSAAAPRAPAPPRGARGLATRRKKVAPSFTCAGCGAASSFGGDALTPCHDDAGAVACASANCGHQLAFCEACAVGANGCSAENCGNMSFVLDADPRTLGRDGAVLAEGEGAGEHVCVDCELPFCLEHFKVGAGAAELDLDAAPERDGLCVACAERRAARELK